MALTTSSVLFRLCGSLRQNLCISPMSSNAKVTSPRRPQSVFSLFWSSQMDKIPKGRNGLIEASRLWRTMTDLEKEPFRATYRIERDNFVKPLLNEQDITERSIQVLKKKIRKYSKERREIFAGRIFQKKLSSYNIFIAEAWSRSKRVPSQKWKDLTPAEVLEYEKKAKFENDKRDLEYENNPLTKEQEVQYIELSEKITKLKREVRAMEKELRSEDK
uniref:Transcription factor A, mitochondrial n=1 Tax=Lepeophtheirus salmonis TaxID=72036 RepID=D3PGY8_LEPSM|nr:Transcription factor A, mitochondrial [Lepeophtheirus salmonis]